MKDSKLLNYLKDVLHQIPADWLNLTTHRLDIYEERLAKTQFLEQFESLFNERTTATSALSELPTAFDYIRLGHPLSSVLEWGIAHLNNLQAEQVITFSSQTIPVMAVLRKNLLDKKNTQILHTGKLPEAFDTDILHNVYGYNFDVKRIDKLEDIVDFDGSTVFISKEQSIGTVELVPNIDFYISVYDHLGSILLINGEQNNDYISAIQHVRRRETIAMTPANCFSALKLLVGEEPLDNKVSELDKNRADVVNSIQKITATNSKALLGSSGLSVQYAIMIGLVDHALENHQGKAVKIIVPPNCYGGTNDQARRVAACIDNVDVMDLPVDGDHNMVQSIDMILDEVAKQDAVPYIIAEIPTNPRVEVPDLEKLRDVLSQERKTANEDTAIDPVFILDQTFCPNVQFLSQDGILSSIRTISYVSGSKFPSGGKCTAGYCVSNEKAASLLAKIDLHLRLCDNEATPLQVAILAEQLPSMNERIIEAYKNTREFVIFIKETLPTAKINFVSEELAKEGFTPSVFSLDLPTKGDTEEERETYKRALNSKLINLMINKIPNESKYCVSYGQLKGCYWTIPATSTQGTTKEGDKDYIVRVSLSANMDLDLHKKVFKEFVDQI
ncbi:MAG: PLP-dependent transferase [Crocinitomicaceae bacterium]|nr:PLP-dependent transferase [Crocinitomicaceae bacterium]